MDSFVEGSNGMHSHRQVVYILEKVSVPLPPTLMVPKSSKRSNQQAPTPTPHHHPIPKRKKQVLPAWPRIYRYFIFMQPPVCTCGAHQLANLDRLFVHCIHVPSIEYNRIDHIYSQEYPRVNHPIHYNVPLPLFSLHGALTLPYLNLSRLFVAYLLNKHSSLIFIRILKLWVRPMQGPHHGDIDD